MDCFGDLFPNRCINENTVYNQARTFPPKVCQAATPASQNLSSPLSLRKLASLPEICPNLVQGHESRASSQSTRPRAYPARRRDRPLKLPLDPRLHPRHLRLPLSPKLCVRTALNYVYCNQLSQEMDGVTNNHGIRCRVIEAWHFPLFILLRKKCHRKWALGVWYIYLTLLLKWSSSFSVHFVFICV